MSNVTVNISRETLDATGHQSPSTAARVALQAALEQGLEPESPAPASATLRAFVYLNQWTQPRVEAQQPEHLSLSETVQGLVHAYTQLAQHGARTAKTPSTKTKTATGSAKPKRTVRKPDQWRREQEALYSAGCEAIQDNRIALLEGSTGVGKSRVAVALAQYAWAHGRTPVTVAAPTLSVLNQLVNEWLDHYGAFKRPRTQLVIGRSWFIDPDRVDAMLTDAFHAWPADDATHKRVRDWLDGGGLPDPVRAMPRIEPRLAWLAEDLRAIAPDAPIEDLQLTQDSDPDNPAEQLYQALASDADSEVCFTTHASIGVALRRIGQGGSARLDLNGTLIADEAHDFDQAIANQHETLISPYGLERRLDEHAPLLAAVSKKTAGNRLATLARQLRRGLTDLDDSARWSPGRPARKDPLTRAQRQALDAFHREAPTLLEEIAGALASTAPAAAAYYGRREAALSRISGRRATPATVQPSPVRGNPEIRIGPPGTRDPMNTLWSHISGGAMLSATLYNLDNTGQPTATFIQRKLSLPDTRVRKAKPQIAPFIRREVTLYTPSRSVAGQLSPPKDDKDRPAYFDALARRVHRIATTAAGGTLILAPAYDDIDELHARLDALIGDRLIVQRRGQAFAQYRDHFESMDGAKPVWLATGPAATGLDLVDPNQPAKHDRRLTDLAVVRIPFGWRGASSQRDPMMGFHEAAMAFRQMIGRLVRRPGTPDRRLWILDGRLVAPRGHHERFAVAMAHNTLRGYRNRQQFREISDPGTSAESAGQASDTRDSRREDD